MTTQPQTLTEQVLASSPAILYACRAYGDYGATFVSSNITQLLGFTRQECLENPNFWRENIHPEDRERVLANASIVYQNGHHVHEYRFRSKTGDYLWILDEVRMIRDSAGNPYEIVGSWLDISRRKTMEDELRESARLKTEFIATASHELRTPLSVAVGYTELLLQNDSLSPEERQEFLSCVYDKMLSLERIIDELLDLNRIESGRTICLNCVPLQLAEEARLVVRQFQREATGHQLTCRFDGDLGELQADRSKIVQVLENLIGNAVKFSPKGGVILVSGERVGNQYQLSICDQGIGVPTEHQEKIFDLFFRVESGDTAPRGMGLGLNLVKNIIEAHKGRVWMINNPDRGSTFHFSLPLPTSQG